jgi:hypothetical protein
MQYILDHSVGNDIFIHLQNKASLHFYLLRIGSLYTIIALEYADNSKSH